MQRARPEPALAGHVHTFATMDGLRGIAAAAVLLSHAGFLPPLSSAVDMFFVISGFVVAHAYEHRLASGIGISRFLRIRLIRLMPLYLLGSVLGLAFLFANGTLGGHPVITIVLTLLMLPAPSTLNIYPANPAAWSLFFEMAVNLAYVFTWRRWTIPILSLISGVSFLVLSGCGYLFHSLDLGWAWSNVLGGFPRVFFGFPMGVLIFRLWNLGGLRFKVPPSILLLATVLVLMIVLPGSRIGGLGQLVELGFVIPAIVAAAIVVEPALKWRRLFLWAGRISYPVYILQLPILWCIGALAPHGQATNFLAVLLVIGASWIADIVYDAPLRAFLSASAKSGH
jgi:peptidoglycan/LPS O-acetylase OafA/YrhL